MHSKNQTIHMSYELSSNICYFFQILFKYIDDLDCVFFPRNIFDKKSLGKSQIASRNVKYFQQ